MRRSVGFTIFSSTADREVCCKPEGKSEMMIMKSILLFLAVVFVIPRENDQRASVLYEHTVRNRTVGPDGAKITFTYEQDNYGKYNCTLYQLGEMIRIDSQNEEGRETIWFDGSHAWRWSKGNDLERMNIDYVKKMGLFLFKAETIGLLMSTTSAVDLNRVVARDKKLATFDSPQAIGDRSYKVILIRIGDSEIRYSVDESTLQIVEVSANSKSQSSRMICTFLDGSTRLPWLPSKVEFLSDVLPSYKIDSIRDVGNADRDDFSIGATDIPVGTAVVDRDQQFRLGYWTGSSIDEEFSVPTGVPASRRSLWYFLLGGAIFVGIALFAYRSYRK